LRVNERTRHNKSQFVVAKAAFNNEKTLHQQIGLKCKEESGKELHLVYSFVWCWKIRHFGK